MATTMKHVAARAGVAERTVYTSAGAGLNRRGVEQWLLDALVRELLPPTG